MNSDGEYEVERIPGVEEIRNEWETLRSPSTSPIRLSARGEICVCIISPYRKL